MTDKQQTDTDDKGASLEDKEGEFTDEELAGLSEEERAALEEDDDADTLREIASEGEDEESDDTDDGDDDADDGDDKDDTDSGDDKETDKEADKTGGQGDDKDGTPEGDDKSDKAAATAKAEGDADTVKKGAEDDFVPQFRLEGVADYDKKMAELKSKRMEIVKKYGDGEITFEEMESQTETIDEQRNDLRDRQMRAEMATDLSEQMVSQAWDRDQRRFFRSHSEYREDDIMYSALDAAVKRIAVTEEGREMTGIELLEEAHKEVKKRFRAPDAEGKVEGEGKPKANVEADKTKKGKESEAEKAKNAKIKQDRKPDLKVVPRTLGGIPPAEGSEVGDEGEFSYLDKLDGIEYETALAKLTPPEQERYLRQSSG